MKRFNCSCTAILSLMAAAFLCTSCIYDRPAGDNFYRTLWISSESPFEDLTIEFLCGGSISAQAHNAAGSFGTYSPDGSVSVLNNLSVSLRPATAPEDGASGSAGAAYDDVASGTAVAKAIHVTFIEARRLSEDALLLIWETGGSPGNSTTSNTSTTAMRRLSEYE